MFDNAIIVPTKTKQDDAIDMPKKKERTPLLYRIGVLYRRMWPVDKGHEQGRREYHGQEARSCIVG